MLPTVYHIITHHRHLDGKVLDLLYIDIEGVLAQNCRISQLAALQRTPIPLLKGDPDRIDGVKLQCFLDGHISVWTSMWGSGSDLKLSVASFSSSRFSMIL